MSSSRTHSSSNASYRSGNPSLQPDQRKRHFARRSRVKKVIDEALNKRAELDSTDADQVTELGRIVALRYVLVHGFAEIDSRLLWPAITGKVFEVQRAFSSE